MTTQIEFIAPVPATPVAVPAEPAKPAKAKKAKHVPVLTGKLEKRWADWAKREWKTALVVKTRKTA